MSLPGSCRAVVTGLGILAPNGNGRDAFWETLLSGRSGISRITRFDASELKSQIAGEVKDFDPLRYVDAQLKPKRRARHTQFAMAATMMALADAGMDLKSLRMEHSLPILMGLGSSSFEMIAEGGATVAAKGPRHASPFVVTEATPHSCTGALSELLGVPTECLTFATACAAGFDAITEGAELIRRGETDVVIAGGTDAPIAMVPLANFDNSGMCSRRNDAPEKASRPFDRQRDSGVISEGCGVVILENLDHALARGATPYLEILADGRFTDPDTTQPGSGFERSMRQALSNAAMLPSDIDYICAWGPSHPVMDRAETQAIKKVFGEYAYSLPVSSIKGVTGNPLAAAGPMMLISCCLMFRHGIIAPTANYEDPDPECDLDYVPTARPSRIDHALLNAHGVGGANSSLILGRAA